MENTLLGIVIDVSASMRKNWGNSWEIKQTKIEAVKNALNEEIVRINAIHDNSLKKDIKLFCLGIGFRLSLKLISAELSDGEEKILNDKTNTILIGIICDILALSELIPSKYKLDKIKKQIHSYWNSSAKNLLEGIEVDEQAAKKLSEYIENELVRSFRVNLHNYIENANAVFRNTIGKIFYFLGIPISETVLRIQAKRLSSKYSNEVERKANDIFNQFSEKYKKLIHERIQNFAKYEITQMLERNGLGFNIEIILENFDKNQLIRLSESIYNEIKKDISSEFMDIWNKNKLDFWTLKFSFLSMLNIFEVKTKTEYTIKNIGWAKLKPFVEDIVFGIFHDTFETVSKEMLYSWVQVSTKREVIRPISELTNILPDTTEKDIYSEEYMFGGTPMYEAINMATLRFNNREFADCRKILLIISDGEYDKANEVLNTIKLIKQAGVSVVCGYISNSLSIDKFKKEVRDKTKVGAQNLMSIASNFGDCPELVELIDKGEISAKEANKLCIQINQPKKLNILLGGLIK